MSTSHSVTALWVRVTALLGQTMEDEGEISETNLETVIISTIHYCTLKL